MTLREVLPANAIPMGRLQVSQLPSGERFDNEQDFRSMTNTVTPPSDAYLDLLACDEKGRRPLRAGEGQTLLRALKDGGFLIGSVCGGGMSCATCHVHIVPGDYKLARPPNAGEIQMLEDSRHFQAATSRLACQVRIDDALLGHEIIVADDE